MNKSKLTQLLKPVVESLGYIFWSCEYLSQGKHSVLRVYIDKEDGIEMEDCAIVSRQVSQLLDVEDPIQSNYSLEISSPGLDRPLYDVWHYEAYVGSEIAVKLYKAINKKRQFKGVIEQVKDNVIQLRLGEDLLEIPLDVVNKANLVS
jgi:ribosome maturation factor RimP